MDHIIANAGYIVAGAVAFAFIFPRAFGLIVMAATLAPFAFVAAALIG